MSNKTYNAINDWIFYHDRISERENSVLFLLCFLPNIDILEENNIACVKFASITDQFYGFNHTQQSFVKGFEKCVKCYAYVMNYLVLKQV